MPKLEWDKAGEHLFETGVKNAVLYPQDSKGEYPKGYAWNGITGITESPSGAEANKMYADDMKYLNLYSAEEFGATVEAYTYPKEFEECDGTAELVAGVKLGQQSRKAFGLCYRTALGNEIDGSDYGYKLHLIYGAMASPSERAFSTINDSPEAITFSWELNTTPVNVTGHKSTSIITVNSKEVDPEGLARLEAALFGTDSSEAYLPLPDKVLELINGTSALG